MRISKKDFCEHKKYLEHRFGDNIDCKCKNRTELLIDFGVYALQNPDSWPYSTFSCRGCQHDRMMKDSKCTFRI